MSEPEDQRPPVLGYYRPTKEPADRRPRERDENALGSAYLRGLIAAALFLLALCLILPRCEGSDEQANRASCASKLNVIGYAILLYADGNAGAFPPSLISLLAEQAISLECVTCPSSGNTIASGPTTQAIEAILAHPGQISYVYLGAGMHRSSVTPDMVIAYEPLRHHDNDGINVLYGDGQVKWLDRHDAEHLLNELKAGHNPPR